MSRTWLIAAALALMLGCTPELEPIRWDAIDVDALREAIDHPTGSVDEANTNEVAAAIVQRHEPHRLLADYLHTVFEGSAMGNAEPPWVVAQALAGTSVYVLVACPGSSDADEGPFTHGSMRVDSPTLDGDVISTLAIRGQLRLSFAACEIGDYRFAGVVRAFRGSDPDELGFVPELAIMRHDQPDHVHELLEPVLWNADDRISALFELRSGETLVLDWYVAQIELHLRGRNGELICMIVGGSLECVPP